MFLKNYTSNVPVAVTVSNIERTLIKCGVSGITKEYGQTPGDIISLIFHISTAPNLPKFTIRIPVDKKLALDALWLDYVDGEKMNAAGTELQWNSRKKKKRADFVQQAERTAWKIMQDWIEVQMSMIQMRQAEFVEVFMPYIYDGKQTVYQRVKDGGLNLMLNDKTP